MTLCGIRQLRKCDDMWYSIVHGERTLCGIGISVVDGVGEAM